MRSDLLVRVRERVLGLEVGRDTVLSALLALLVYRITRAPTHQVQNTYVWLADAFLHGRFDVAGAPTWLDWVEYEGRRYSHQGPLPGVLAMPFVAVFGLDFDLRIMGQVLGTAIAVVAFWVAGNAGLEGAKRWMAWAFPVLGTTLWYEATQAQTWGIATLVAALMLLLALNEHLERRRPHVLGLLVGLAALSRPPAMLAAAGFALILWRRDGFRAVVRFGVVLAVPLALLVGYNLARFGTITDKSVHLHYLRDPFRNQRPPGLFSLAHIPYNLYSWFFMSPAFQTEAPFVRPHLLGTAFGLTSPVAVAALASRRERWLWICAFAVVIPSAVFYANGFVQFGMRYLLDAVPFLFLLACFGLADGRAGGYSVLLAASVLMNGYGVWYTNSYGLKP